MSALRIAAFALLLCAMLHATRATVTYAVEASGFDAANCGDGMHLPCRTIGYALQRAQSRLPSSGPVRILVGPGSFELGVVMGDADALVLESTQGRAATTLTPKPAGGFGLLMGASPPVTVRGFTVRGFNTTFASVESSTSLTLEACAFVDSRGGPLLRTTSSAGSCSVTITACSFENIGPADSNAVALFDGLATVVVSNSSFVGNTAGEEGGVATFAGMTRATLVNCTFARNKAARVGALVFTQNAQGVVHDCSFEANTATAHTSAVAVRLQALLTVTDSRFVGNRADAVGCGTSCLGGTVSVNTLRNVVVTGTLFEGNVNPVGAAVLCLSRLQVNNSAFVGNEGGSGAALYLASSTPRNCEASVARSRFEMNRANSGPVAFAVDGASLSLAWCQVRANEADRGGIRAMAQAHVSVEHCEFADNVAELAAAALAAAGAATATVRHTRFVNNSCGVLNKDGQSGGVALLDDTVQASFDNCSFESNRANDDDGGVFALSNLARLALSDCTLTGNSARQRGGAIFAEGRVTCQRCVFEGNSAARGGALFVGQDWSLPAEQRTCEALVLANTTFARNSALVAGGGVMWQARVPFCASLCDAARNCSYDDNRAAGSFASDESFAVDRIAVADAFSAAAEARPGQRVTLAFEVQTFRHELAPVSVAEDNAPILFSLTLSYANASDPLAVKGVPLSGALNCSGCSGVAVVDGVARFSNISFFLHPGAYVIHVNTSLPGIGELESSLAVGGCADRFYLSDEGGRLHCERVVPISTLSLAETARHGFLASAAVFGSLSLVAALLLWRARATPVVEHAQGAFCAAVLLGVLLGLLVTGYSSEYPPSEVQCALAPWLQNAALALIGGALLAKLRLVVRNNLDVRYHMESTDLRLRKFLGIPLLVSALYLALWTAAGRARPHAFLTLYDKGTDNAFMTQFILCRSPSPGWPATLLVLQAAVVLYGVLLALRTSHIRTHYNERTFVSWVMYALLIVLVLFVALFVGNSNSPERLYVVSTLPILAISVGALLAIFAPKVARVLSGNMTDAAAPPAADTNELETEALTIPKLNIAAVGGRRGAGAGAGSGGGGGGAAESESMDDLRRDTRYSVGTPSDGHSEADEDEVLSGGGDDAADAGAAAAPHELALPEAGASESANVQQLSRDIAHLQAQNRSLQADMDAEEELP